MTEIEATSGITERYELRNYSGVSDEIIRQDPSTRTMVRELSRWIDNLRASQQRGTMFDRGAFTPPENPYDEMRAARTAVEFDDVVSGVADITEAFAFQGMKFESQVPDEADVFNQWAAEINMDGVLRRLWREEYTCSQVVVGMTWGWREYTVRGRALTDPTTEENNDQTAETLQETAAAVPGQQPVPAPTVKRPKGRKRRKKYRLWVPTKITVLDALKVVPVGFSPVGPEKLAWVASKEEVGYWWDCYNGRIVDFDMTNFFTEHYKPSREEQYRLSKMGVPSDRLLLMNPDLVWRHCETKADYEAYPSVRMKSLFGILDLKRQLMNADRASLIGAANYILLVRKGTDQRPAQQAEIDALRESYNFIAKMPIIISDHRLEIQIIAPKIDLTLQTDKYDVLDHRLLMRLLGTLSVSSKGQRNETNLTLSHAVARLMENRRHMMKRAIEANVCQAIIEHPNNKKGDLSQIIEEKPNLVFLPRHVTLDFDAALLQSLVALRTQREISRETILEQFGFDQATEALRMEYEEEFFDPIFKTAIPFNGQPGQDPATHNTGDSMTNGKQGGRPVGGGEPSKNAAKPAGKTANGNTKKGQA